MAIAPLTPLDRTSASFRDDCNTFFGTSLPAFVTQANSLAAALTAIAAGTAMAIPYTFSSTTTDSDPGAGFLRLSNATQNLAATMRLDLTGADGSTWTSVLDTFDDSTSTIKGHIMLQKLNDATKWMLFAVTALASPTGYKNLTVSCVSSSTASPFADGDSIVLKFTRNGDKGDTGNPGMILLATLTPTVAANLDALTVFTSLYDNYLIFGDGIVPAADDSLHLRFANAGSADSGSNYFTRAVENGSAQTVSSTSSPIATTVTAAGKGCSFALTVMNANDASNLKAVAGKASWQTSATPGYIMTGSHAVYAPANAISGVRFFWNSGANFSAVGKIRIYGYNNT